LGFPKLSLTLCLSEGFGVKEKISLGCFLGIYAKDFIMHETNPFLLKASEAQPELEQAYSSLCRAAPRAKEKFLREVINLLSQVSSSERGAFLAKNDVVRTLVNFGRFDEIAKFVFELEGDQSKKEVFFADKAAFSLLDGESEENKGFIKLILSWDFETQATIFNKKGIKRCLTDKASVFLETLDGKDDSVVLSYLKNPYFINIVIAGGLEENLFTHIGNLRDDSIVELFTSKDIAKAFKPIYLETIEWIKGRTESVQAGIFLDPNVMRLFLTSETQGSFKKLAEDWKIKDENLGAKLDKTRKEASFKASFAVNPVRPPSEQTPYKKRKKKWGKDHAL